MVATFDILLKHINVDEEKTDELSTVFELYEKMKSYEKLECIYKEIRDYFLNLYKIHSTKAILYNSKTSQTTVLFHNGKEFTTSNELVIKFDLKVSAENRLTFAFCTDNVEHKEEVAESKKIFEILFYLIDPIVKAAYVIEELKESSFKDDVTDVYNRKFLLAHLNKMIPLAKREAKNIGFLIIGVDHFKAVIDEFDYTIGDLVLIELANVLKANVRESDIVVRLGSDEFLVVLANIDCTDSALMVAKKLIDSFSKCEVDVNSYTGQTLKKTVCVGVSMYPEDSTSVDQLLKNADIALYEAKNLGRSQVLKFENDTSTSIELF